MTLLHITCRDVNRKQLKQITQVDPRDTTQSDYPSLFIHRTCLVYRLIFKITSVFTMAQAQGINFHFIRKERLPNSFLLKETHGDECFCLACRSASYMEKFIESSERELGFYQTLLDFMRKKRCRRVFQVKVI